jgi:hypothetical protein
MKTVVIERDAYGEGQHKLNQCFYQFSKDMGFLPKLCKPYRPQTKGKVERMVRYVRDNFYRPLSTKLKASELNLDVETANVELLQWLDTVANQRLHDTTKEKPADKLKEERPYLQNLPPELLPALPQVVINEALVSERTHDEPPLHHELSIYEQLLEGQP